MYRNGACVSTTWFPYGAYLNMVLAVGYRENRAFKSVAQALHLRCEFIPCRVFITFTPEDAVAI
jgi:hypothetical protein